MSLVNIWVKPTRALMVVDTAGGTTGGLRHETTKMVPLVHARTIVAVRGYSELLGLILQQCTLTGGDDFDAIVDKMPDMLRHLFRVLSTGERGQPPGDSEVTVVGWSQSQKHFLIRSFRVGPGGVANGNEERKWRVAPGDGMKEADVPAYPNLPKDLPKLRKLARRQVEIAAELTLAQEGTPVIIGGRLLIAEMTHTGRITIEAHALD